MYQLDGKGFDDLGGISFGSVWPPPALCHVRRDRHICPALISSVNQAITHVPDSALQMRGCDPVITDEPIIIEVRDQTFVACRTRASQNSCRQGFSICQRDVLSLRALQAPALSRQAAFRAMNATRHIVAGENDRDEDLIVVRQKKRFTVEPGALS